MSSVCVCGKHLTLSCWVWINVVLIKICMCVQSNHNALDVYDLGPELLCEWHLCFCFFISDLIHCTNEMNVNVPQLADTLFERTASSSWVVVFKALITTHHLMMYGNEVRDTHKHHYGLQRGDIHTPVHIIEWALFLPLSLPLSLLYTLPHRHTP